MTAEECVNMILGAGLGVVIAAFLCLIYAWLEDKYNL